MAGGPYNIPRDTKGEGRILMVFSTKAFIATGIGAVLALITIYPICSIINLKIVGWISILIFGFIGFAITTFKIPSSNNFEIMKKTAGESIYEVLSRLIKFRMKKNKIYVYFTEDKNDDE